MEVSLHFGGKSHASNGQNVSFKEPSPGGWNPMRWKHIVRAHFGYPGFFGDPKMRYKGGKWVVESSLGRFRDPIGKFEGFLWVP